MKLNFKGFFKAAGLCPTGADALTGCITVGLWFPIPQRAVQASLAMAVRHDHWVYRWQKIVMEQKAMFLLVNRWTTC